MVVRATVTRDSNGLTGGLLIGADEGITSGVAASFTSGTAHRGIWSIVGSTWVRRVNTALSCTAGDVIEISRAGPLYTVYKNGVYPTSWNDITGIVARGPGNRGGGYHGHSDVNFLGAADHGMTIGDITIADIVEQESEAPTIFPDGGGLLSFRRWSGSRGLGRTAAPPCRV